jgi:hypothetical protein
MRKIEGRCWMLDAVVTGCWVLVAGFWMLDAGYSILVAGYRCQDKRLRAQVRE